MSKKITEYTELLTPADGDLIEVVDVSEATLSEKNKKVTLATLKTFFESTGDEPIAQSNLLYVDANGFIGTPVKGDMFRPYQTYTEARDAMTSDNDIIVLNGVHNTLLPVNRQGDNEITRIYAPTPQDGITVTANNMTFAGLDNGDDMPDGSKLFVYGDGTYRNTGVVGPPVVFMSAAAGCFVGIKADFFQFHTNTVLLSDGFDFVIKTALLDNSSSGFSNGSLFSATSKGRYKFEELVLDVDLNSATELFGVPIDAVGGVLIYDIKNITSTVAQSFSDHSILDKSSNSFLTDGEIIIRKLVNNVDAFSLVTGDNGVEYKLEGDIISKGNLGSLKSTITLNGAGKIATADSFTNFPIDQIYTNDGIDVTFPGDVHLGGDIFVQGASVNIDEKVTLGVHATTPIFTDLINENQQNIAISRVLSGVSETPRIVEHFNPFIKTDLLGAMQTDDSETFAAIPFLETLTDKNKFYFPVILPSANALITNTWFVRTTTGIVKGYLKVYLGTGFGPNDPSPYWKTNTDKQIIDEINLVTDNPGAGVDTPFPLGNKFKEDVGEVFTYIFIAENDFITQGATIDIGPPFGITEIPYITGQGSEWMETELLTGSKTSILSSLTTGVLTGGEVTINAGDPTKYDIAAGTGQIVDWTNPEDPKETPVSWVEMIGLTPPDSSLLFTALAFDAAGTLVFGGPSLDSSGIPLTRKQKRGLVVLQVLLSVDGVNINEVAGTSRPAYELNADLIDWIQAHPPLNSGNTFEASSATTIRKLPGTTVSLFGNRDVDPQDPTHKNNDSIEVVSSLGSFQNGVGGFSTNGPTTTPDLDLFDDGSGTLQTMSNNKFAIRRIIYFGSTNSISITYGQVEYDSLESAQAAIISEAPVLSPFLSSGIFTTAFIHAKNADLTDPLDTAFFDIVSESITASAASASFSGLLDTPGTYAGQGGKVPIVNSGETALEYVEFKPNTFQFPYEWDTNTADTDPGTGKGKGNNATLANITILYMSESSQPDIDRSMNYDNLTSGDLIFLNGEVDSSNMIKFRLSGVPVKSGNYYKLSGVVESSGGTFGNQLQLTASFFYN